MSKAREEIVREKLDLFYFKIYSLDADSFYRIEISAHNAIGWSKPSYLVVRTAPGECSCEKGSASVPVPAPDWRAVHWSLLCRAILGRDKWMAREKRE